MNFYRLVVSYDGTDFCGWQSQKHSASIQATMIDIFVRTFCLPCRLLAASRTDTGVHARGQVVCLRSPLDIPDSDFLRVFNSALPPAIKVVELQRVNTGYNPHANIVHKEYAYRIFLQKPCPTQARFGWFPPMPNKVDWEKFMQTLQVFVGEHDFTGFARIEADEEKIMQRKIVSINTQRSADGEILVTVIGVSFLRYQIRRMIGAAFEVARKKQFSMAALQHSLVNATSLPAQLAFNAPPQGLCLRKIVYELPPTVQNI